MKAMDKHKTITHKYMLDLEKFSTENFSYDPNSDALKLRRDILYLAKSLKKIGQYNNDTNTVLDFGRTVIDQELIVIDGKSNVEADGVGVTPFTWTKKATKQAKTSTAKHRNLQEQKQNWQGIYRRQRKLKTKNNSTLSRAKCAKKNLGEKLKR
jgi:hypothetical protein